MGDTAAWPLPTAVAGALDEETGLLVEDLDLAALEPVRQPLRVMAKSPVPDSTVPSQPAAGGNRWQQEQVAGRTSQPTSSPARPATTLRRRPDRPGHGALRIL
ncbi:hypothetical protein [Streptomyces ardesiacus]|uniref:Nudix hydrolase domain-containing protein n=1 Tax=Streptomyces ardesiacus TaxID=285564 RepID=A0ABW8HFI0_9ACTN